ncbi:hypothetical protein Rhein_3048 [Rheinheimera sp. A13L]|uniref:hypothetical protein n=1 Tax=Rheinheimera sp. A13L TaxID=506534 RepID=UPI0002125440|nr:hypothetical protein [Rheinheimera sp. A13L]EGM76811.1 hypothetical protein Rhein_3048 [Rheinheimera sp. A13L]
MKRFLLFASMAIALSGCGLSTPKDEQVCIDLLKEVVSSPEGLVINRVERTEGNASLNDIRELYSKWFDGDIPPATLRLLDLYERNNVDISQTFVSLDATYDGRVGKVRENVLCRYLSYDDKKELISFTFQGQDIEQHKFLNLFLMRNRPSGLDSNYRVR